MWKNTSYYQNFLDDAILDSELMEKNGRWREIVHDKTLTLSGISE